MSVTQTQQELLELLSTERSEPDSIRQRAKIVLLAFQRKFNDEISQIVGLHRNHVGHWRQRWMQAFDQLVQIECSQNKDALREAITQVLSDLPRSGRPTIRDSKSKFDER